MSNPYLTDGPTLISFSGGRTSAFMLHQILQAHGGELPSETIVAFANTGKEREETLRFVHDCAEAWNVRVHWLEYKAGSGDKSERYEIVGYNSASRVGEPFSRLIRSKKYTPNSIARFCTEELKVNTIRHFLEQGLGWKSWTNIVGIRHDEGHRALKAYAKNAEGKSPWVTRMPLDKARVTKRDVMDFWSKQPFDLNLKPIEGNCDLCFLKGRGTVRALIRQNPASANWWIEQEQIAKGTFSKDWSYATLKQEVRDQPDFFDNPDDMEFDAECGLVCGVDE